jgi:hypothetical protein
LKKYLLPFIWMLVAAVTGLAQEDAPVALTYQSFSAGMGRTSAYDSYLSPLKYSGTNISLMAEQIKPIRWRQGRVATQHLFHLEFAETENPTGSAIAYVGDLEYDYALHYRWNTAQKVQVWSGVQGELLAGVIHNLRNSNNPVSAKVNLNLNLSAMIVYPFLVKRQPVRLRYQVNVPVAGALFSPEYGQSYYEIGLGGEGVLVHFAAWHNRLAMRNIFSVELPLNFCTLRITGMNRLYQTRVNDLKTQIISNSFYVGVSKYFYSIGEKKVNKDKYRYVFE